MSWFALLVKAPLATGERLYALALSICSFVCLSVAKMRTQKRNFLRKTTQFRAMASIEELQEVPHGLFKEPIIGPQEFKMAQIRHLENREIAVSQRKITRLR